MKSPRFLTDWWVLVVSPEAEVPGLLAFLDRLTPLIVQQLAFRVFVVFGATNSGLLPIYVLPTGWVQILAGQ